MPAADACTDCARCRARALGASPPYTPTEFAAIFGVANPPEPTEVPDELVALGLDVDAALDAYDDAVDDYRAAVTAKPHDADRVADAQLRLAEADGALMRARAAYNNRSRALTESRLRRDYLADQAAQAAAREAARAARPRRMSRARQLLGGAR